MKIHNFGREIAMGLGVGALAGAATAAGALMGITQLDYAWAVFVVAGTAAALIYNAKHAVLENTVNRTNTLRRRLERLRRDVGDVHGMTRLMPYSQRLPLPLGGGWALTGDSAALLARETILRKPSVIVELGSGVSTLILGQILAARGEGRLVSLDHDEGWAHKTRQNIEELGLGDIVEVVHVQMVPTQIGEHSFLWYSLEDEAIKSLKAIDILVVDGPPKQSNDGYAARFPALPMFSKQLSPDAMIFVDDAARADERSMVEKWIRSEPHWRAEWFDTVDGVAILSRGGQ